MKLKNGILFICLSITCISSQAQISFSIDHPRMVAEWEPALGVLIAWPLCIPYKLVIELANDSKLFVLVEDHQKELDAIQWFTTWSIKPDRYQFITAPQGIDVSWTRDWGPHAVFEKDGTMKLADGEYVYATPEAGLTCDSSLVFIYKDKNGGIIQTNTDDKIPDYIASALNINIQYLPFAFTGGNVISDGRDHAFSTCILTTENKYKGVSNEKFLELTNTILGIKNYHIISNFEKKGIQHIDCYMKLLDEERIFVMRPPKDHPAYQQYENIADHELRKLSDTYGRPYRIIRLDTDRYKDDRLAAYSNSLILNHTIYVPLFGIPQDATALKQWSEAMPGYTIKGFEFKLDQEPALSVSARNHYKVIGWNSDDALHCRTRAIWDPNMTYISVNPIPSVNAESKKLTFVATIRAYGNRQLLPRELKFLWRKKGVRKWKSIPLNPSNLADSYTATLNKSKLSGVIEYYIQTKDQTGKMYTMPAVAPKGYYSYSF